MNLQHHLADADLFAVAHGSMLKLDAGLFTKDDLRAGASGDLLMAADEIGVQVCFDHILDLKPLCGSFCEVLVDVTLWIDDHGLAIRADQVRSVGQTCEIELFEIHFGYRS